MPFDSEVPSLSAGGDEGAWKRNVAELKNVMLRISSEVYEPRK